MAFLFSFFFRVFQFSVLLLFVNTLLYSLQASSSFRCVVVTWVVRIALNIWSFEPDVRRRIRSQSNSPEVKPSVFRSSLCYDRIVYIFEI